MQNLDLKRSIRLLIPFGLIAASLFLVFRPIRVDKKRAIVVASKSFTEQEIVGEITARLIEGNTDITVIRKFYLGGTMVCFNALKQGDVDMYVEYSGTALVSILNQSATPESQKVLEVVRDRLDKNHGLLWMDPLGFNNAYTLTMRAEHAKSLGIGKISDLLRHQAKLTAGFDHEFMDREDGYPGLKKRYGLEFKKPPLEMDPGLMIKAIATKQVDVICGFATDGRIPAYNLVVLEDDLKFFPPYDASVVIRKATLKRYPELAPLLEKLASKITDEKMRAMNYAVDEKKLSVQVVAQEFLQNEGLR